MANETDGVKFSIGENTDAHQHTASSSSHHQNKASSASESQTLLHQSVEEQDEDHRPHQLFCEMDELDANLEWKEAARWLKFEEDVEHGGRWSKPHVATLQLHSLFELRSCLLNGATLLDFPGDDLASIVGKCLIKKASRVILLYSAGPGTRRKFT